jgi:hypothetical protein
MNTMKKIYFMLLCGIYLGTQPGDKKSIGCLPTNFLKMPIYSAAAKAYRQTLALSIKAALIKPNDQMNIKLSNINQLPK